tara:strand:- start:724 stop:1830 length:1107 start_codon:yes stop_codon:yes gene_type:complete
MNILICAESFYPEINGVSSVITNLASEFIKKNFTVSVATKKISNRKKLNINKKGVRVHQFDVKGNLVRGIAGEKKKYTDFLKKSNYDIIFFYAAQQWSFDLALPLLDKLKAKICFAPCGFSRLNNFFYKNYFRLLFNKIKFCDLVIFHSKYYQDYLICKKKRVKNICVIHNGSQNYQDLKINYNNFRKNNIIIISEIKFNKGIDRALLSLIFSKLNNNNLIIYTQKKPKSLNLYFIFLKLLIFFLKIKNKFLVKFKYGVSEKKLHLERKKAFLFLFGSRLECSPLVLFESAAAGLPFISFNVGNSMEISKITGAGFSVNKIMEMTNKLNFLYKNKKLNIKLSKNGIKNSKNFTWKKIADQYISKFKSL